MVYIKGLWLCSMRYDENNVDDCRRRCIAIAPNTKTNTAVKTTRGTQKLSGIQKPPNKHHTKHNIKPQERT